MAAIVLYASLILWGAGLSFAGSYACCESSSTGVLAPRSSERPDAAGLAGAGIVAAAVAYVEYTTSPQYVEYQGWVSQYKVWVADFETHRPIIEEKLGPDGTVIESILHWKGGWDSRTFVVYHADLQDWHDFLVVKGGEVRKLREAYDQRLPGVELPALPDLPGVPRF
jgi:hypothetical protein